ncbi:uncharacterized protein PHALS_15156 [Plasmopara halstedii]|uniref:Uncharacterized protein n=1 Tax=Plasmopara halstedii TaxID=4781 RepID=A0A0P1B3N5_PLAHL|nr:uncharacterized protein PHALS_15156 [Plasmopara halstedii]CEG48567.1 hypothetical protein PHALS_15156 [Plasmopara halstedii]|eukprot:XP_024584936.1 hypothetical protein PHALS_15156 [Plasmopara halstedii]
MQHQQEGLQSIHCASLQMFISTAFSMHHSQNRREVSPYPQTYNANVYFAPTHAQSYLVPQLKWIIGRPFSCIRYRHKMIHSQVFILKAK